MNNKKQTELIARVITLPFCDISLYYDDLLSKYMKKHYELFNEYKSDSSKSRDLKNELSTLRQDIIDIVEKKVTIKRNDNIRQIINAFYSPYEISSNKTCIELQYLQYIMRTARSFLTFRDGIVSIKWWVSNEHDIFCENGKLSDQIPDKIEIWNTLMRVFTPDVYIAALYASTEHLTVDHLIDVRESVCLLDKPLAKVLEKGIAETHLHMNAGAGYLSVWEIACNVMQIIAGRKRKNDNAPKLLTAGLLRLYFTYVLKWFDELNDTKNNQRETLITEFCKGLDLPEAFESTLLGTSYEDRIPADFLDKLYEEFFQIGAKRESTVKDFLRTEFKLNSSFDFESLGDILGATSLRDHQDLHTPYEIIMEFKIFKLIREMVKNGEDKTVFFTSFVRMFVQYIRLKNSFFDDKMQGNVHEGLNKFMMYFDNATHAVYKAGSNSAGEKLYRKNLKNIYKNMCSQLSLRKLEVRISPDFGNIRGIDGVMDKQAAILIGNRLKKQLTTIFEMYIDYYDEEVAQYKNSLAALNIENRYDEDHEKLYGKYADELQSKHVSTFPALGIIYHFIKHRDFDNFITNGCWAFNSTEYLNQSIQNIRDKYSLFIKVLNIMRSKIPNLSKYIVGVDAASIENETEPWVLAPVFLKSRSAEYTYPNEFYGIKINNLGITYHVGEDYYHILSGLRHIHEVVTQFGYKSGDRIGHAIALQLDADEWASENKMVAMPRIEYLDNLLWLWKIQSSHPELFNDININFEHKILEVSELIYGSNSGLTPYVLWQAYAGKFLNLDTSTRTRIKNMYIDEENPKHHEERVLCKYYSNKCPGNCISAVCSSGNNWDKDRLIMTHHCPIYNRHYYKSIFIPVTKSDTECIKVIQRFVKNEIERNGVYVEVNPTSNAVIGSIHNIYDHPFTNLNSDGTVSENESNIMISINSDDPLVFNTNVENELAIVYYTLLHKGVDRAKALYWIDKIRQYGMDSSFIKLEISPSAQRRELKSIIEKLNKLEIADILDGENFQF